MNNTNLIIKKYMDRWNNRPIKTGLQGDPTAKILENGNINLYNDVFNITVTPQELSDMADRLIPEVTN